MNRTFVADVRRMFVGQRLMLIPLLICSFAIIVRHSLLSPTHPIWSHIFYYANEKIIITGHLTIIDKTREQVHTFGNGSQSLQSVITILDKRFFHEALLGMDVGLGESYVNHYWETDDISKFIRLLLINSYTNAQSHYYLFTVVQLFSYIQWFEQYNYKNYHSLQHDVDQDESYIHHHYDRGVALFESFLDETMTYTAARFDNDSKNDLAQAQIDKVKQLVKKANIKQNNTILEIGCGFGYLANYILNHTNASSVTAITLSRDQLKYAKDKYYNEHLQYLYRDYRYYLDTNQSFDAIISVEMIEAIGRQAMEIFFKTVSNSLKQGGAFVIQYSANGHNNWILPDNYKESNNTFVQKHIFPGGFIPDEADVLKYALQYGLQLVHSEKGGLHYAKTLQIWFNNLVQNEKEIIREFDERTYRAFKYYLAWSQAMYQTQTLHVIQATFVKTLPDNLGHNLDQLLNELNKP
eukprot:87736_1